MEPRPDFDLLWTEEGFDECPFCGEQIFGELAEVVLIGESRLREDIELGGCTGCGMQYGLIDDLLLVLQEEGIGVSTIERFQLNRRDVRTGVLLLEPIGSVPWDEFRQSAAGLDEQLGLETPDSETVSGLSELSEVWQIGLGIVDWLRDSDGNVDLTYVAIVVDGEGLIRHFDLNMGRPHDATELARVIREATVRARPGGKPGRPAAVLVEDPALAQQLESSLRGSGIDVRAGETPDVADALAEMARQMRRTDMPPFLSPNDEDEVRSYLKAARAFYRMQPWNRIAPTKCIAFRFDDDGEWAYLSVMGQGGEEFGFSVFEDWLQVCLFFHNPPSYSEYAPDEARNRPLYAAGGVEQLSLEPMELLHPEDGHLLRNLGAEPIHNGQFPVARRFVPGLQQEETFLGMREYGVLMEALVRALRGRKASRIVSIREHVSVGGMGVELKYPATGVEELAEQRGYYRLIAYGRRTGEPDELLQRRTRLEVDAPGDLLVDRLARMVRDKLGPRFELSGILYQGFLLWSRDTGRGWPSPTLAHLARLSGVQCELEYQPYTMRVLTMEPLDGGRVEISLRGSGAASNQEA